MRKSVLLHAAVIAERRHRGYEAAGESSETTLGTRATLGLEQTETGPSFRPSLCLAGVAE